MRATLLSRSSPRTLISRTPWALRLMIEMSSVPVRTKVPWSLMSMSSSPANTCTAATRSPLRSLAFMAIMPLAPRPLTGNSLIRVRLP